MKKYDLIIVGAGPAGLSAAIYAARAGLDFLVIESAMVSGGQVLTTSDVDNYPGLMEISGWDLAEKMRVHADRLGAKFETHTITQIEAKENVKLLHSENGEIFETTTILLATGASARKLNVLGEEELKGSGVSYCATCDGNFYRGKVVAVVGGGDTAMEDALYLANICEKVYLIHRRASFRAANSLVEQVAQISNIECVMNTNVVEIKGTSKVEKIAIDTNGKRRELAVEGVFVAVGVTPVSSLLNGVADMDEAGYVIAAENCATTCKGVYVAGDVRKKPLRQIVTAVADGANAIYSIVEYLNYKKR